MARPRVLLAEDHAPAAAQLRTLLEQDFDVVRAGFEAGAIGYVLKNDAANHLLTAVHLALRGERYVSGTTNQV